eukprot:jgi/Botrbrau1/11035/Bobra.92_2s0008.1
MAPAKRTKSGTFMTSGLTADEMADTLDELQRDNVRLRTQLALKERKEPDHCGYLFKYRPYSTSLFSPPWELRYFTLSGSVLHYFHTEKDAAAHPRGRLNVAGLLLESESEERDKYHAFAISDRGGQRLLRLASSERQEAEHWMKALHKAGCELRLERDACHRASVPPSRPDARAAHASGRHALNTEVHEDVAAHSQPSQTVGLSEEVLRASGLNRSLMGPNYASDSGMSEAGPMVRPTTRAQVHTPLPPIKRKQMTGSSEMHVEVRPSMLSSDRIALTQHSGILNVILLILFAANFRLIVENLLKYGVLVNPLNWVKALIPRGNVPLLLCWPALSFFAFVGLSIQKFGVWRLQQEKKAGTAKKKKELKPSDARKAAAAMARVTESICLIANTVNVALALFIPCAVIQYTKAEPVPGSVVSAFTIVLFLKLVSYAHCNGELRQAKRTADLKPGGSAAELHEAGVWNDGKVHYPDNITLGNLAYFLVAPTLIYQPSYPQSPRLRVRWLFWQIARLAGLMSLLLVIVEQYLTPTIANSIQPLRSSNWAHMLERVLKLSLPTLYGWIIMFYCLFHIWLNILAEVTYFGDREFYKDWWNATTIGDYWRLWNMPVHKWMLRHVYFPLMRLGVGKFLAGVGVFAVSGVFHELAVGLPLHMIRYWAFLGVMFQVPMVYLTEYLKKRFKSDQIGNLVFWISFCIIGQPISLILYYHDWILMNRPDWLPPARNPASHAAPATQTFNTTS